MKKIFSYGFTFLVLLFPGTKGIAQLPKLSNAFYKSSGIVVDSKGNAFVSGENNKIIKITPDGKASDFAGSVNGYTNQRDGKGATARFDHTKGIAIDVSDNIYVADYTRVRKITPDGMVTTFAGNDKSLQKDGTGTAASFREPQNIAIDNSQNLYVTDEGFDVGRRSPFM